jgi:hypothetical protein
MGPRPEGYLLTGEQCHFQYGSALKANRGQFRSVCIRVAARIDAPETAFFPNCAVIGVNSDLAQRLRMKNHPVRRSALRGAKTSLGRTGANRGYSRTGIGRRIAVFEIRLVEVGGAGDGLYRIGKTNFRPSHFCS